LMSQTFHCKVTTLVKLVQLRGCVLMSQTFHCQVTTLVKLVASNNKQYNSVLTKGGNVLWLGG